MPYPKETRKFKVGDWVYFDPGVLDQSHARIDTVRGVITYVEDQRPHGYLRVGVDWEDGYQPFDGDKEHLWIADFFRLV